MMAGIGSWVLSILRFTAAAAILLNDTSAAWTSASSVPTAAINAACSALASAIPGKVLIPGQLAYITEMNNYWNAELHSYTPQCIVQPDSAQLVSQAVSILGSPHFSNVPFAVKSGGHDPNPGHSAIESGVIIALSHLNGTTYDAANGVAYVKPGGNWGDVISTLDEYGVTVVGGRLAVVGIGGYLTGGGLSFLSAQYGFACDSFVELELVLPNGTIANVNAQNNADLLKATKGGSNQFGIVTQFTLKTYPLTQVWGGIRIYSVSSQNDILTALHDFTQNPVDPKAAVIVNANQIAGGTTIFTIFYFYDGPSPPAGVFKGLEDVSSETSSTQTYDHYADLLNANDLNGGSDALGDRASFRSLTLPLLPSTDGVTFFNDIVTDWLNITKSLVVNDPSIIGTIAFQPLQSYIGAASQASGGNAYGLTASDKPRFIIEQNYLWSGAITTDDQIYNVSKQVTDQVNARLATAVAAAQAADESYETYNPYFLNDAAFNQDVFASWKDVHQLRALQREIDPSGLFANRIGGFHLNGVRGWGGGWGGGWAGGWGRWPPV